MGRKIPALPVAATVSTLLLILATYWHPLGILRVVLGIPFLLFVPGYALTSALIRKAGMTLTERLALSFGLSLAVVPAIGLVLNYTPWGIRLEPVLYGVAGFNLITSWIVWFRQESVHEQARPAGESSTIPSHGRGRLDKVLTIIMVATALVAVGTIALFIIRPKGGEVFTQFYILNQEGGGVANPDNLKLGEEGSVILAINNHEGSEVTYRMEMIFDGDTNTVAEGVLLADQQEWQGKVSFLAKSAGTDQKLEFYLYRDGQEKPYLGPLYVWINVN